MQLDSLYSINYSSVILDFHLEEQEETQSLYDQHINVFLSFKNELLFLKNGDRLWSWKVLRNMVINKSSMLTTTTMYSHL